MQPVSRQQLNRNKYVRITSFEGKNDSFRIATGDPASRDPAFRPQRRQQPDMAPDAVDASLGAETGEISPECSFTTVILDPVVVVVNKALEQQQVCEQGGEDSSGNGSPPTHPAFYPGRSRASAEPEPPQENVCPSSSMTAPFSSPLAALVVCKLSKTQLKNPGGEMLDRFLNDDDGGEGEAKELRVLGNIDTNILAAEPIGKSNADGQASIDTTPNDAASKKSKRSKSKKTNRVNGGDKSEAKDETVPPETTSYAEAVKEDPAVAEKRLAEVGPTEPNTKPSAKEEAVEQESSEPTPAGNMTFAQAVKEVPVGDTATSDSKKSSSRSATAEKSGLSTTEMSQASTAVDYPEIQSNADDQEQEQRRRDKEKAAVVVGARWAPLGVPFKRRLQTLAVLTHCVGMGLTLSIFFSFCAVPLFWPIIILYLVSILFSTAAHDGKLKRRNEWFRRLPVWTYFAEYFPAKLHKTHELLPTRKYILGYHPHGIISHGAWAAFATDALGFSEKFPGITNCLVTLESNFHLPFYREYVLAMGLQSVSKQAITNILTRGGRNGEGMGRAATIVIGGARESLEAQPNTLRLVINERKGFIKLALQTGADVVPVLAFGENDLYDQLDPHMHPWLHGIQHYVLKAWKFTVPLLHGRGIFNYDVGLMPYRRPLNIVVGKPIPVVQAGNPDNTEINRLHELYVEELQKIWDRYKDEFAVHRKEEMLFMD